MCGAAVEGSRFPLDDERVDGLRQEDRQRATRDKIGVAGYSRGFIVTVVVVIHRIILLVLFLRVILLLRICNKG